MDDGHSEVCNPSDVFLKLIMCSLPSLSISAAWHVVMAGTAWSIHLASRVWASFVDGGTLVPYDYGGTTSVLDCPCLWEREHTLIFFGVLVSCSKIQS